MIKEILEKMENLAYKNNTKTIDDLYFNLLTIIHDLYVINDIHGDYIDDIFNLTIGKNRKLKNAFYDLYYYDDEEINHFNGNLLHDFVQLSLNKKSYFYSREASMKIFENAKTLIDILKNAKVPSKDVKMFLKELGININLKDVGIFETPRKTIEEFNKINLIDKDKE